MPTLKIEDLENGGNQKAIDAIKAGVDQKELKKLVRHLRGLDLRHTNFEYLKRTLMPLMSGYFMGSAATNIEEPIYRAVPWATKPTDKAQLGYPPPGIVPQGRANNPGKPMFYGSAGCHSTIMELGPNVGDRLAISKWRTKANLPLVCVGYTAEVFKEKSGMNRFEELPWVKQHAADPLSSKQGNEIVHEFLAREFTKKFQKIKSGSTKFQLQFQSLCSVRDLSESMAHQLLNLLEFFTLQHLTRLTRTMSR